MFKNDFFVYILKEVNGNRTYVGYTIDLEHRLRQHNGFLKGGAVYTSGRKWDFICFIRGFPDHIMALQCEWKIKHPYKKKKKLGGVNGRIKAIEHVMNLEKLTSNSHILNSELYLDIFIKDEYIDLLNELPNHMSVMKLSSV